MAVHSGRRSLAVQAAGLASGQGQSVGSIYIGHAVAARLVEVDDRGTGNASIVQKVEDGTLILRTRAGIAMAAELHREISVGFTVSFGGEADFD